MYKIVKNDDRREFEKDVTALLQDGWKLAGGVAIILPTSGWAITYVQALYK